MVPKFYLFHRNSGWMWLTWCQGVKVSPWNGEDVLRFGMENLVTETNITRWWFQIFFIFNRIWEDFRFDEYIFQMGTKISTFLHPYSRFFTHSHQGSLDQRLNHLGQNPCWIDPVSSWIPPIFFSFQPLKQLQGGVQTLTDLLIGKMGKQFFHKYPWGPGISSEGYKSS